MLPFATDFLDANNLPIREGDRVRVKFISRPFPEGVADGSPGYVKELVLAYSTIPLVVVSLDGTLQQATYHPYELVHEGDYEGI